jgi:Protein kinase domain
MSPATPQPLSAEEWASLQTWAREFEAGWTPEALATWIPRLPAEGLFRRLALLRLIKTDLSQRWQHGEPAPLESYLAQFPELTARDLPPDVIWVECEARQRHGTAVTPEELLRRFPAQASLLLPRLQPPSTEDLPETRGLPGSATNPVPETQAEPRPCPSPPAHTPAGLPETFGRYRIVRKLGEGGMGAVYLAQDTQLSREVALKVPSRHLIDHPEVVERFYREARAAATFHHPNLCPIYDVGAIDGIHYLTMPYIPGRPLSELIRGTGPLPPREVAALVRKLALAMQEAHDKGVIHRDLKPANVMVTAKHEPIIMDFGLARREDAPDPQQTPAGQVLGTPAYMSPEQVRGDTAAIGPHSDVYSMGVLLYELLTGRVPFSGSVGEVFSQVLTRDPAPPSRVRADVDLAMEAICLKAMARNPAERHPGMQALAEDLGRYLAGPMQPVPSPGPGVPGATPPPLPPGVEAGLPSAMTSQLVEGLLARLDRQQQPRRFPVWAGIAAAVLAVLLVALIVVFRGPTIYNTHITQIVTVRLTNILLPANDPMLVFVLNGKPIDPKTLAGPVELPVGENRLVVKRGDDVIEERVFQVATEDAGKEIAVPPDADAPTVAVHLKDLPVDANESELQFTLDGKPVPLSALRGDLKLRAGLHELVVTRGGREVDRAIIPVAADDAGKVVPVAMSDRRRVPVMVAVDGIALNDRIILVILLDGVPVSPQQLKKPMSLLPGKHELVVWTPDGPVQREFQVRPAVEKTEVSLTLQKPEAVAQKTPREIQERVKAVTASGKPREKVRDALVVIVVQNEAAVPFLCELLFHNDHKVRWVAAETLLALAEKRPDDRRAMLSLFRRVADGVWYDPHQVDAQRHLIEDPEHGGKGAALAALRKLASPAVVTMALTAALTRDHGHQRIWALQELKKQPDRLASVPTIRWMIAAAPWYESRYFRPDNKTLDEDPEFGGKAEALAQLRELAPDLVARALIESLSAKHPYERGWAATELKDEKAPADRPAIVTALVQRVGEDNWYLPRRVRNGIYQEDPEHGGKAAALEALRYHAPDRVTDALLQALKTRQGHQRLWALRELAKQPQAERKRTVAALRDLVARAPWYYTRYKALEDSGLDADPRWGGKAEALTQLRELAPGEVTPALIAALKGNHQDQRLWAAQELRKQRDPADRSAIIAALRERIADKKWYRREYTNIPGDPHAGKGEALALLRDLAPGEATAPLMQALTSSHADERTWAANELANQKDPAAIPALKKCIQDRTWGERTLDNKEAGHDKAAALKALETLAPREVKSALQAAEKANDRRVQEWARQELAKRP